MNTFTLELQDATHSQTVDDVSSFVAEDATGSFGILAGHARLLASTVVGLARFRVAGGAWQYLAMPGAVLYFKDDVLTVSTRRFLIDEDYQRISQALREQLLAEEQILGEIKESLRRMEEEVLQKLWHIGRGD